jgi:hypothetical protein
MPQRHALTAGIDLGGRYTHVCLLDSENGEVIEERAASPPTPKLSRGAFRAQPRCAHSDRGRHPLALGESSARGVRPRGPGRQRPQRVRLICGEGHKNDKIDALREWRGWPGL